MFAGIDLQEAQELKNYLRKNDLLIDGYRYHKERGKIWFPVKEKFDYDGVAFADKELIPLENQQSWREAARDILSEEEHALGRFGYDTVGSIAIIEIVDELIPKEKELAGLLLDSDKHVSTVLKKASAHVGELRQQKMTYLAGEDTRETIVHENGVKLKVNVEEVYYSIRLGTDRNRIMKRIKSGEDVLCMFSGLGPYPIVFKKNTEAGRIVGVELNKKGHELALGNAGLNKVDVELYQGDVNEVVPKLEGLFDRITMPLPHTGEEFLPLALEKIRDGGVIHYYCFIEKEHLEEEQKRIEELVKKHEKTVSSIEPNICGQHSPSRYRVCFDMVIK